MENKSDSNNLQTSPSEHLNESQEHRIDNEETVVMNWLNEKSMKKFDQTKSGEISQEDEVSQSISVDYEDEVAIREYTEELDFETSPSVHSNESPGHRIVTDETVVRNWLNEKSMKIFDPNKSDEISQGHAVSQSISEKYGDEVETPEYTEVTDVILPVHSSCSEDCIKQHNEKNEIEKLIESFNEVVSSHFDAGKRKSNSCCDEYNQEVKQTGRNVDIGKKEDLKNTPTSPNIDKENLKNTPTSPNIDKENLKNTPTSPNIDKKENLKNTPTTPCKREKKLPYCNDCNHEVKQSDRDVDVSKKKDLENTPTPPGERKKKLRFTDTPKSVGSSTKDANKSTIGSSLNDEKAINYRNRVWMKNKKLSVDMEEQLRIVASKREAYFAKKKRCVKKSKKPRDEKEKLEFFFKIPTGSVPSRENLEKKRQAYKKIKADENKNQKIKSEHKLEEKSSIKKDTNEKEENKLNAKDEKSEPTDEKEEVATDTASQKIKKYTPVKRPDHAKRIHRINWKGRPKIIPRMTRALELRRKFYKLRHSLEECGERVDWCSKTNALLYYSPASIDTDSEGD